MAKQGKARTFIEYLAAQTIFTLLRIVPVKLALKCGSGMGAIAYLIAKDLRRTGQRNLLLAFPEKSQKERTALLKGCFASLGRTLGLFSHFLSIQSKDMISLLECRGLSHLDEAKKSGHGLILFTAHIGAWELTSFGLSVLGRPITFLVRRMDNEKIERLIDQSRTRFGNCTIDKLSAARSMLRILRSGEVLGLLTDLNTLGEEGIFVDFFGVPASTNFVMAKLALRTGTPIIPVFAPWDTGAKKYLLEIQPEVRIESTGDENNDVRKLTETLSSIIENKIRQYPDQWLWVHKRWKTRPRGEPDIYT